MEFYRPTTTSARQLQASRWTAIAIVSATAVVGSLAAGLHFTAEVRLGSDRTVLATTALAVLGALAAMSALVARRIEPLGLVGIAIVCVGTAGFWLSLGRHRFAGPVIMTIGREHGIHIGDPLALLPVIAGGWVLVLAIRVRKRERAATEVSERSLREG